MTSIIDSRTLETRVRAGRTYSYDPVRKLFLNSETDKWVQNPVTRRKFIVSSKRVYSQPVVNAILEKITSNTNQKECYQYVLRKMAMKSHLQTSKDDKSIWHNVDDMTPTIWIHHHFFLQLLGYDYRTLMDKLVRGGILIERDVRTVKGRFPTYLFAEPEFLSDYTLEPVTCAAVDDKIERYVAWTRQYFTPLEDRITRHIVDNFWTINLTPDQFDLIWEPRYETKYLPKHPKKPMTFEKYKKQGKSIYKIIKGWNDADRTEKLSMFSKDDFGNRLHHVFSYLPSECRQHVCDREGRPVEFNEIDLCNSQPTIFANILVLRHGLQSKDHKFIRLVEAQYIYEDLISTLKITADNGVVSKDKPAVILDDETKRKIIRGKAKVRMLIYMFGQTYYPPQKEFERLYGEPAVIASAYKSLEVDEKFQPVPLEERHTMLPRIMQREESLMFREVWSELFKRGFSFLPVHDAVYIAGGDKGSAKFAKDIMRAVLTKHLKIEFGLKPE